MEPELKAEQCLSENITREQTLVGHSLLFAGFSNFEIAHFLIKSTCAELNMISAMLTMCDISEVFPDTGDFVGILFGIYDKAFKPEGVK